MGLFDTKKTVKQTVTNTSTVTDQSKNLGGSSVGVGNAYQSAGDLNIEVSDEGAIAGGFHAAENASNNLAKSVDSSLEFAGDIGTRAIDAASSATDRSLDFGEHALEDSFTFGTAAIKAVSDSSSTTASTLSGAISKAADATRSDVSQSFDKLTKYGAIALAVVGVAIVAFIVLKK